MIKCLKYLKGKHDFSTFRASSCRAKTPVRTISSVSLKKSKNIIEIKFTSRSFLQNQVRSMVGAIKYVGEKYGVPTPEGLKATKLLAKKEGIILDPVYTSKGFSALIDYVKKGIIKKNQNVIFIFTGGSPAVFAYNNEIAHSE